VARANALLTPASVSASLAHLFEPSTGIAGSSSHQAANPSGISNSPVAGSATLPGSLALGGGAAPASPRPSPQTGVRNGASAGSGVTDPYTLYTFGDSYTGSGGLDRQSFLAQYHPDNSLIVNRNAPLDQSSPPSGPGASSTDPGLPGPLATTNQDYNFGL